MPTDEAPMEGVVVGACDCGATWRGATRAEVDAAFQRHACPADAAYAEDDPDDVHGYAASLSVWREEAP
jgi:hypothetical protein